MGTATMLELARAAEISDEEVVRRVLAGDIAMYEILMRRYNQRLYRIARVILRDDAEAEDVMQDAYVRAYEHLAGFEGRSSFATWLTRIAVHEALARKRRRGRYDELDGIRESQGESMEIFRSPAPGPEQQATAAESRALLEEAIEALPESYRSVLLLRDIEEMSTADTANALELSEATVKTRLHRAHAMLRKELYARTQSGLSNAFPFHLTRCDRVVKGVFERISKR